MNNTEVRPCVCTEVLFLVVKQAGAKSDLCPKWEFPWFAREQGAEYQDAAYGKGKRLHNRRTKDGHDKGWTCTVCGRQKDN